MNMSDRHAGHAVPGTTGTTCNLPVSVDESNNPGVTQNSNDFYGSSCLDRNP
jgi:hypothetical protein